MKSRTLAALRKLAPELAVAEKRAAKLRARRLDLYRRGHDAEGISFVELGEASGEQDGTVKQQVNRSKAKE